MTQGEHVAFRRACGGARFCRVEERFAPVANEVCRRDVLHTVGK